MSSAPLCYHRAVDDKRRRLLDLAADIPARCRLVEVSEGGSLERKLAKLRAFGPRYLRWAAARLGLPAPKKTTMPLFWGRKIALPWSDDADFVTFYLAGAPGGPEYKLVRWLIRNLKDDDCFYDAGANHGFFTFLACELLGASGEVHAFEPMKDAFDALVANAPGPGARLVEAALWDKTGTAPLYRNPLSSSLSTLEAEVDAFHPAHADAPVDVATVTLDDYARRNRPPTVVKIDVEGGERRLLSGGAETFKTARPAVAMEVWTGEGGERFSLPAAHALFALGYSAHALTEEGGLTPVSEAELPARLAALPAFWDNYIFLPS